MKKFAFLLSIGIIYCITLKAQDSLQHYVAKYKFPQGSMVTEVDVVMENGVLMVNSTMGSAAIERSTGDEFTMPSHNGTVVFTRNEAKKITGIKIDVMNISLEGIREQKENSIIKMPVPIYKSTFPMKFLPSMLTGEAEDLPILTQ